MINRDIRQVDFITYEKGTDRYGQQRMLGSTKRTGEIVIYKTDCQINNEISHIDADYIGLTREVVDFNQVVDNGVVYEVKYVMPTKKWNQVYLKQV